MKSPRPLIELTFIKPNVEPDSEGLLKTTLPKSNVEIKLKLFKNYVNDIARKIDILESNKFNLDISSQKIEVFLKFYQIYYDVLNFQETTSGVLTYDQYYKSYQCTLYH